MIYGTGEQIFAQATDISEYEVKAVFIYNFTKFISWPEAAFSSPSEPFIIGIIGSNPFDGYLTNVVANEKVDTHPIEIKVFNSIKEIDKCHILYIQSNDVDFIRKVLTTIGNTSVLTVNESDIFSRLGGHIRFLKENNKIRFQINTNSAKNSKLQISSKLLSIAKIY
ncbi:MAG TPA: YfiR family protein [Bacteroidia bacterium]|nr:YfiR family protein [Bacteroidia bacterium]